MGQRNHRESNKENIGVLKATAVDLGTSIELKNRKIDELRKDLGVIDVSRTCEKEVFLDVVDTLYCAVFLCDTKTTVAIPTKWIKRFDSANMLNNGLNTKKKHMIFYSSKKQHKADFRTARRTAFSETESGVYIANILRFFGKFE